VFPCGVGGGGHVACGVAVLKHYLLWGGKQGGGGNGAQVQTRLAATIGSATLASNPAKESSQSATCFSGCNAAVQIESALSFYTRQ
jgi:hypothetical protein